MTFSEKLKKYRKDHDLTVKQLAEKTGFSPSYHSMLENGREPSGNVVKRCVQVDPSYFSLTDYFGGVQ